MLLFFLSLPLFKNLFLQNNSMQDLLLFVRVEKLLFQWTVCFLNNLFAEVFRFNQATCL